MVTVTSAGPGVPGGTVPTIWVELSEVMVRVRPPTVTSTGDDESPARLVPVMVIGVPPVAGPSPGTTEMTVGAEGVHWRLM